MVSYRVTHMWRKMLPSRAISRKQTAILEGLLKMKESMTPVAAQNSHRQKKPMRIASLDRITVRRCLFCRFR